MASSDRKWIFSLVWINVAVAVIALLIQSTGRYPQGWTALLHILGYVLVYANVTAIPAILFGQTLIEKLVARRVRLVPAVLVVLLLFGAVGCLMAQAILNWIGVEHSTDFWREYFGTLRFAVLLAATFGMGAFFYGSMRERLRETEKKLHEKEIAEERLRKLVVEAQLRSLESRLHPHFLFNTLNSISSLIAVNPARAEQIVGRLGALLRSSLDNTNHPLIALDQELTMVEDYVDIEKVRFGDKVRARIEVGDGLRRAKVPPLSIQSLVENAVKYAITPQREGGEVLVTAAATNGSLRVEVSDTGPGFELGAIPAGHGLDNLVGRLDALFGSKGQLKVARIEGRCVVEMLLPLT
jgi:sensor histidine kinase YesM